MEVTVNHLFDQALKDARAKGAEEGEAKARAEERLLAASIVQEIAARFQVSPDAAQAVLDAARKRVEDSQAGPATA